MTGFIEDSVLRFEGLDDNDIANLNRILPAIQNLVNVYQAHVKQINEVQKVLLPIVQKILAKQKELGR